MTWIFMISQGSLGNLGVYLIHPPKLCARLVTEDREAGYNDDDDDKRRDGADDSKTH